MTRLNSPPARHTGTQSRFNWSYRNRNVTFLTPRHGRATFIPSGLEGRRMLAENSKFPFLNLMSKNAASTGSTDQSSINTTSVAASLLPGTVLDFPSLTLRGRKFQHHFRSLGHELEQKFPCSSLFFSERTSWRGWQDWGNADCIKPSSCISGWVTFPKLWWWGLPPWFLSQALGFLGQVG